MRAIEITLPDALFAELKTAAALVGERGFTPERFAQEAVESVLASRRLRAVAPAPYGPRIKTESEPEPITHPVRLPEKAR